MVDVENEYYTAKCSSCALFSSRELIFDEFSAQRDTPAVALASFAKIVENEAAANEQGEFGFKALKQMTKLNFKLQEFDKSLESYKTLLGYTKKGVTRNVAEKSINGILDYVSAETKLDTLKMQEFYEVTIKALEDAKNDVRTWLALSRRVLMIDYSD